ncbi:MAG TPA: altronate dehydratase family protein [Anaeromyxobacteraceae bacterium]
MIAKTSLRAGTVVETEEGATALREGVGAGHKIAFRARAVDEPIHRYGQLIGVASSPIQPGDHVHTHNLHRGEMRREYEVGCDARPVVPCPPAAMPCFQGFLRPDGRVGTRNYVAVVSTVNCSATVSKYVGERFRDVSRDFPGIDGVVALTHRGGCGHIANGEDHRLLERVLAGYALHPNVAAYIIVGLGCEVNQPSTLIDRHRLSLAGAPGSRPPVVGIQAAGGTRKAVEAAVAEVARLLPRANEARRTRQPVSHLVLGTNCGGSDGYSGITANPALGWAADELIRCGGTAVLGETTEIYGAEQVLIRRAVSQAVAQKLLDRIAWWRRHLQSHGADVDHNPSPGNVAGGISTILEKSLGGVAKGGTTPLVDVVEYAERIAAKGLVFMDTPGYDPASVTGMVAGGANLIAFTTGRGSVFGCKPVPSVKLATNSDVYRRMEEDMDIDCGVILAGSSIEEVGRVIFGELVEVASGKRTKSELLGIGDEEFDPWLPGPTI